MHFPRVLQAKYTEAEQLCARAMGIGERALGTDHPTVGAILCEQGELLKARVSAVCQDNTVPVLRYAGKFVQPNYRNLGAVNSSKVVSGPTTRIYRCLSAPLSAELLTCAGESRGDSIALDVLLK